VHTIAKYRHSFATNANRRSNAHKLSKPVRAKRVGNEEWVEYASAREAGRQLGLTGGNISAACRTEGTVGGYHFEYAEPNELPLLEGEDLQLRGTNAPEAWSRRRSLILVCTFS
jgi:hypothetical protein